MFISRIFCCCRNHGEKDTHSDRTPLTPLDQEYLKQMAARSNPHTVIRQNPQLTENQKQFLRTLEESSPPRS